MAQVDPVLCDLILIRSAGAVGARHGLTADQVRARWKQHNSYGVEKARRITRHLLAAAQDGTPPAALVEVAQDIRLGADVCLADVLTEAGHAPVRRQLATGPRRP